MAELKNLLLAIFGCCVAIGTSICTAVFGWGLQPRSWWWIIGGSLGGFIIAQVILEASKSKKD